MTATTQARRVDPDRRGRIIDACLDVIASEGVAGTSHRRVAAAAGVPLGSMTYHFAGMGDLLSEAFTRFADHAADEFAARMDEAATLDDAREFIVASINEDVTTDPRGLVLTHELYTLAARDERYRAITRRWLARNHETLLRRFDPSTARILDAVIEGLSIHRALAAHQLDDDIARDAVRRVTSPQTSRPIHESGQV